MNTKKLPIAAEFVPATRCSEYHAECADVTNHASCWSGIDANGLQMMKRADGYCPFLLGEAKRNGGTGCG